MYQKKSITSIKILHNFFEKNIKTSGEFFFINKLVQKWELSACSFRYKDGPHYNCTRVNSRDHLAPLFSGRFGFHYFSCGVGPHSQSKPGARFKLRRVMPRIKGSHVWGKGQESNQWEREMGLSATAFFFKCGYIYELVFVGFHYLTRVFPLLPLTHSPTCFFFFVTITLFLNIIILFNVKNLSIFFIKL